MADRPLGIYIHVPFCVSKCAYCDFYSLSHRAELAAQYVERLICEIHRWGGLLSAPPADTLYFGGGTPSLLAAEQIKAIIDSVQESFSLTDAEITLEANPAEDLESFFHEVARAGVNRVSIGLQTAVPQELQFLSRRHTAEDARRTVAAAKGAGIKNLSLDLMLGIPDQTEETLKRSVDFVAEQGVDHVSAYLLSLEAGTPLFEKREALSIPDADAAGELYLTACALLRQAGYERYEISNFAKNGCLSRHNTKYWLGEEYLGLGPAAHSLLRGKRFYYKRDLAQYLTQPTEIPDGPGGDVEETVMLRLRLKSGLSLAILENRFGQTLPAGACDRLRKRAELFQKNGLLTVDRDTLSLTDQGAVVSNAVITDLLGCLEK